MICTWPPEPRTGERRTDSTKFLQVLCAHAHKHTHASSNMIAFYLPLLLGPPQKCLQTYSSDVAIPTTHGLKHSLIQSQLEASFIKHLSLVGITSDESVNLHSFALPNSMTPCLGLVKRAKMHIISSLSSSHSKSHEINSKPKNFKKKFLPHLVERGSAN